MWLQDMTYRYDMDVMSQSITSHISLWPHTVCDAFITTLYGLNTHNYEMNQWHWIHIRYKVYIAFFDHSDYWLPPTMSWSHMQLVSVANNIIVLTTGVHIYDLDSISIGKRGCATNSRVCWQCIMFHSYNIAANCGHPGMFFNWDVPGTSSRLGYSIIIM